MIVIFSDGAHIMPDAEKLQGLLTKFEDWYKQDDQNQQKSLDDLFAIWEEIKVLSTKLNSEGSFDINTTFDKALFDKALFDKALKINDFAFALKLSIPPVAVERAVKADNLSVQETATQGIILVATEDTNVNDGIELSDPKYMERFAEILRCARSLCSEKEYESATHDPNQWQFPHQKYNLYLSDFITKISTLNPVGLIKMLPERTRFSLKPLLMVLGYAGRIDTLKEWINFTCSNSRKNWIMIDSYLDSIRDLSQIIPQRRLRLHIDLLKAVADRKELAEEKQEIINLLWENIIQDGSKWSETPAVNAENRALFLQLLETEARKEHTQIVNLITKELHSRGEKYNITPQNIETTLNKVKIMKMLTTITLTDNPITIQDIEDTRRLLQNPGFGSDQVAHLFAEINLLLTLERAAMYPGYYAKLRFPPTIDQNVLAELKKHEVPNFICPLSNEPIVHPVKFNEKYYEKSYFLQHNLLPTSRVNALTSKLHRVTGNKQLPRTVASVVNNVEFVTQHEYKKLVDKAVSGLNVQKSRLPSLKP